MMLSSALGYYGNAVGFNNTKTILHFVYSISKTGNHMLLRTLVKVIPKLREF